MVHVLAGWYAGHGVGYKSGIALGATGQKTGVSRLSPKEYAQEGAIVPFSIASLRDSLDSSDVWL